MGKIKENLELVKQDSRHLIDQANIENNGQAIEDCSKIINKSTNQVINEIHKLRVKVNNTSGLDSKKFLGDFLGSWWRIT